MAQSKADLLKEIKKLQEEINQLESKGTSLTEDELKAQEKLRNSIIRKAREVRKINQEQLEAQKNLISAISEQESGLKSLTGIYTPIKEIEKQRVKALGESSIKSQHNVEVLGRAQAINEKIAGLTSDDIVQRQALNLELEQELNSLRGRGAALDYQKSLIMQSNALANQYAGLTEGQKEQLEAQVEVYDKIKKAIGGVLDTASLLFRGPAGFFGSVLIGAGMFEHKLAEVKMQLGGISDIGTTALAFIDDNAVENAKALSDEFGGISNVSTELQASTSLISTNMGISGTEAASLAGSFARLNGNSEGVALDMVKTTQQFAKQNGIIPSQLMADLADSTEAFALFGKDGGENILRAAGYAKKLGVNMSSVTGLADNLLDFETSITKELELSALMGKNINLDRARALAYAGDLEGMTTETLKALGGQAAFNKMDYFQKKASADLLGVSVDELSKMVANQENANELGTTMAQKFSIVGETISAGMNKYLGVGLEGLGGMIIAAGQLNGGFNAFGINMKGIISSTGQVLKNLLGMVAGPVIKGVQAISSSLSETKLGKGVSSIKEKLLKGVGSVKPEVPITETPAQAKGGGMMEKFAKMDMKKLVQGAAAILVLSAALFVAAKAFQEFGSVSWEAVGMGLVGLTGLATIAFVLGKASGQMIQGALAVAVLGAALIPFAFAMNLISGVNIESVLAAAAGLVIFSAAAAGLGFILPFVLAGAVGIAALGAALVVFGAGLNVVGQGMGVLNQNLAGTAESIVSIGQNLIPLFGYIAPIAALSLSLMGLAAALTAVGVAGTVALPGLLAIQAAGAVAGVVGGVIEGIFGGGEGGATGGEGGEMSALLDEIKGLRADLNSGKVAVYLDGKKVTSTVARVANTSSVNTYVKR